MCDREKWPCSPRLSAILKPQHNLLRLLGQAWHADLINRHRTSARELAVPLVRPGRSLGLYCNEDLKTIPKGMGGLRA